MWPFEKRRFKNFLEFLQAYDDSDKSKETFTHSKITVNPNKTTMAEVFKMFNMAASTEDFIGHSMALYQSDTYKKTDPCAQTFEKVQPERLMCSPFLIILFGRDPLLLHWVLFSP